MQSNSNDSLNEVIRNDDKELMDILRIICEISCQEIYEFYLKENQINIENQIVKMTGVQQKVIDQLMLRIFGLNSKTGTSFTSVTPIDFMKKFKSDNMVKFFCCFLIYFLTF